MFKSLSILFLLSISTLQAQEITIETKRLVNQDYIVSNTWKGISIDKNGEDVNSKIYGGISYPPRTVKTNLQEKRTTIASGRLIVNVEFMNPTSETWEITQIELKTLQENDLKTSDFEVGQWDTGTTRTSDFVPNLDINKKKTQQLNKDLFIGPTADYADNRIWLEISYFLPGNVTKITTFQITFRLKSTSNKKKQLQITADKTYLLASKSPSD